MKLMIVTVLAMAVAMTGCVAKKPMVSSAEQQLLENCFPKIVYKEVKKGNLELVPGSGEEVTNPFTGEKFTCPEIQLTDKGREAIMKHIE